MRRSPAHLVRIAALLVLSGCTITIGPNRGQQAAQPGQPAKGVRAPQKQPTQPAGTRRRAPNPPPTAIRITDPIVFGNGKSGAFQGLAYVLPPNTQRIPPIASLVPFATLYTNSFEIQAQDFSSGFPGALVQNEWFLIHYEGEFSVPSAGTWQLRVVSDDGAILYIDDKKVVDNDGVHTSKTANAEVALSAGPHWLGLDYFQASKGQVALMVSIGQNGKFNPLVGNP